MKSVSDEVLNKAAKNVFIWQSGDYNALVKLRGSALHRTAQAMHQRFTEAAGREPSEAEIAHMKQLVVTLWNSRVCLPEGSDPFDLLATE